MSQAEEMAALRRQRAAHIDSVDREVRESLSKDIEEILDSRYGIQDHDGIYVFGSWARGEAIPRISDIDVRVVVDTWKVARPVCKDARDWFKNTWSPDHCPDPFLFVDILVWANGPRPEQQFTKLVEPGGDQG